MKFCFDSLPCLQLTYKNLLPVYSSLLYFSTKTKVLEIEKEKVKKP